MADRFNVDVCQMIEEQWRGPKADCFCMFVVLMRDIHLDKH